STATWTWAVFPYAIYWPVRVVWDTTLSAFLLSVVLLLTLRMQHQPPRPRAWIVFGLMWGVITLTNTDLLVMLPFCLIWLLYWMPNRSRQLAGVLLCLLTAALVVSPWLARNRAVFGRLVMIRDNLPLEMHMANNDRFTGLWTRNEHPGNDPEAMRRFQELGELGFMDEKRQEVGEFIREHPGKFISFSLERAVYFWIGTPQATIIDGYDLIVARHVTFFLGSALAFAGLWLTIRN